MQRVMQPAAVPPGTAAQPNYGTAAASNLEKIGHQGANILGLALSMLLPWGMFTFTYWLLSFEWHFNHLTMCWLSVLMCALIVVALGFFCHAVVQRRIKPSRPVSWYGFVTFTTVLGFVLGCGLGAINYATYMRDYYLISALNFYAGVDPAIIAGTHVLDAGQIVFVNTTSLNKNLSMGWSSGGTVYCAAPIISSSSSSLVSYDFWAVGTGCCTVNQNNFHCANSNSSVTHSGVRVLDQSDIAGYRQAVSLAQATYLIQAARPIFLSWVEDPIAEVSEKQEDGSRMFIIFSFIFFWIQLIAVAFATLRYWRHHSKVGEGRGLLSMRHPPQAA